MTAGLFLQDSPAAAASATPRELASGAGHPPAGLCGEPVSRQASWCRLNTLHAFLAGRVEFRLSGRCFHRFSQPHPIRLSAGGGGLSRKPPASGKERCGRLSPAGVHASAPPPTLMLPLALSHLPHKHIHSQSSIRTLHRNLNSISKTAATLAQQAAQCLYSFHLTRISCSAQAVMARSCTRLAHECIQSKAGRGTKLLFRLCMMADCVLAAWCYGWRRSRAACAWRSMLRMAATSCS